MAHPCGRSLTERGCFSRAGPVHRSQKIRCHLGLRRSAVGVLQLFARLFVRCVVLTTGSIHHHVEVGSCAPIIALSLWDLLLLVAVLCAAVSHRQQNGCVFEMVWIILIVIFIEALRDLSRLLEHRQEMRSVSGVVVAGPVVVTEIVYVAGS